LNTLAAAVGVGARTSVGLTARHTAFLLRAGVAGFHEASILDVNDELVTIGSVPTLPPLSVGVDRVRALAEAAMDEAVGELGDVLTGFRVRIILGLDEPLGRKVGTATPAEGVAWALRDHLAKRAPNVVVETIARGEASPGLRLAAACEELAARKVDLVLLGGAHSDYDPDAIRQLSSEGKLFGSANINGIIPGESAAFVALTTATLARQHELPVRARLHSIGSGFEKARPDNDEAAFDAMGLTLAVRAAAKSVEAEKVAIGWMLTDMTAEVHRVNEWQAVYARSQRFMCEPQCIDSHAHKLGRMGAAALPLHVAIAAVAWRHGFAPHAVALSMVGSDSGERVATIWSGESRGASGTS
jgi:3-oxoacyl-[acyl-carrier-protein] synthase-1